MEIIFRVTGPQRKEMVKAISEILEDCPSKYKGPPTFAYEVGEFQISKDGILSFDNMTDRELVKRVLEGLADRGFEMEKPIETEEENGLAIEVPLDGFTEIALENLTNLITSKGTLIKKAIGAEAIPVVRTENTLKFPWFSFNATGEEINAYSRFIGALCEIAKEERRVSPKEKVTDNDKFSFRVFLIRLGLVGADYKDVRKVLLQNLSGNSAYRSYTKGEQK
jgi:hypothetical protein